MDVVREFLKTIAKMFAADLWLSLTAVAVVATCGAGLWFELLPQTLAPWLLGAGVLAALSVGVVRGAKPKS